MKELALHVAEPWLSYIEQGKKTVEGRRGNPERYAHFIGNRVRFFNDQRNVDVRVKEIRHYKDLYAYLDKEDYQKVVPGLATYQDAVDAYHQFYSDQDIEEAGGMLALEVNAL